MSKLKMIFNIFLFCYVIGLVYFLGGGLQFLGVFSVTQTNFLVIIGLAFFLLLNLQLYTNINIGMYLWFVFFMAVTAIAFLIVPANFVSLFVYLYYFVGAGLAFMFGYTISRISYTSVSRKYMVIGVLLFALLQCLFLIFQSNFAYEIVSYSAVNTVPLDAKSGTFYVKSDMSLAFFFLLVIIWLYFTCSTIKKAIPLIVISALIILTTESKIAHAYLLLIFILIAVDYFISRFSFFDNAFFICIMLLATTVFLIIYSGQLSILIEEISTFLEYSYLSIEKYSEANRFAPIASYIYDEKILFGHGLLNYYNPISDSWLYYAGFSLLYSLYYDLGFIYLLLFYFLMFKILKVRSTVLPSLAIFGSFVALSIVSFILTDYAFLIALGFVVSWLNQDAKYFLQQGFYKKDVR